LPRGKKQRFNALNPRAIGPVERENDKVKTFTTQFKGSISEKEEGISVHKLFLGFEGQLP